MFPILSKDSQYIWIIFGEQVSFIHKYGWRGYSGFNGLVDLGYKKHVSVAHGNNQFANVKTLLYGKESFRDVAKTRLSKYIRMNRKLYYFHIKECEFRFNNRNQDRSAPA